MAFVKHSCSMLCTPYFLFPNLRYLRPCCLFAKHSVVRLGLPDHYVTLPCSKSHNAAGCVMRQHNGSVLDALRMRCLLQCD